MNSFEPSVTGRSAEGEQQSQPNAPRTTRVQSCPLCGSSDARILFRAPDRLFDTPGEYTYRRCSSCATVFQDPRIVREDLHLCYPADYRSHGLPAHLPRPRSLSTLREVVRRAVVAAVFGEPLQGTLGGIGQRLARYRWLRSRAFFFAPLKELKSRPSRNRRALDIGCGTGVLLRELAERGWEASGVEWDEDTAAVARRVSGRPVHAGDFRGIELPSSAYDLVVLQHVLEHLDDPKQVLQRIADLLAPAGRAVLVYPNTRSLGARLFAQFWFAWDPPRHLVLSPSETIVDAATRVGLSPVRTRTSARSAPAVLANSRAYRAGRKANETGPGVTDRLLGLLEKVLVRLGFGVGEEVVIVLGKDT